MSEPLLPLRESADESDRTTQLVKRVAAIPPAPVDVEQGWEQVLARASGASPRAAKLVDLVSAIPPRPVDVARGWDDVIERVAKPRSGRVLWFGGAAAAVLLAWVSLQWPLTSARPSPSPAPAVAVNAPECEGPLMCVEQAPVKQPVVAAAPAPAPKLPRPVAPAPPEQPVAPETEEAPSLPEHVLAAAGAVWATPGDGTLGLERGRIEVSPHAEEFTVMTPDVSIAASGARYAADVTEAGTAVRVFEGEVEVLEYASRKRVTLLAGEQRAFVPGTAPSALDVVPAEVSSPACARYSLEQRLACLATEAKGDGLRAQVALYESAYLLARAGRAASAELELRESLRRFDHGVLGPEARLALIKVLKLQGRLKDAGDLGREFLAAHPQDPRSAEVAAWLRTLDFLLEPR